MADGDKVYGVAMVKDEADVIAYTLAHLRSEKLDGFLIVDNMSNDGTQVIVHDFHDTCHDSPNPLEWYPFVMLADDPEVGYYQSRKMTNFAEFVHTHQGANWIVPFDADELWHAGEEPLGDYLRSLPSEVDCVNATLYNYFPTSRDGNAINPMLRITNRDREKAPLNKVALRWREGMVIHQGNHGVDGATERIDSPVTVCHFPWRSFNQFKKKVRNGAAAYAATDLPEEMGAHWRGYGRILEQGEDELREGVWDQWFFDPPVDLICEPAPWCRWEA